LNESSDSSACTRGFGSGREFYDRQREGVGGYFFDSLFAEIDSLVLYAGIHRMQLGHHRMLAKRFPYAIYYRVTAGEAVVHRCSTAEGIEVDSARTPTKLTIFPSRRRRAGAADKDVRLYMKNYPIDVFVDAARTVYGRMALFLASWLW